MALLCPVQEEWLHDRACRRDKTGKKKSISPERAPCLGDRWVLEVLSSGGDVWGPACGTGASDGTAVLSLWVTCS